MKKRRFPKDCLLWHARGRMGELDLEQIRQAVTALCGRGDHGHALYLLREVMEVVHGVRPLVMDDGDMFQAMWELRQIPRWWVHGAGEHLPGIMARDGPPISGVARAVLRVCEFRAAVSEDGWLLAQRLVAFFGRPSMEICVLTDIRDVLTAHVSEMRDSEMQVFTEFTGGVGRGTPMEEWDVCGALLVGLSPIIYSLLGFDEAVGAARALVEMTLRLGYGGALTDELVSLFMGRQRPELLWRGLAQSLGTCRGLVRGAPGRWGLDTEAPDLSQPLVRLDHPMLSGFLSRAIPMPIVDRGDGFGEGAREQVREAMRGVRTWAQLIEDEEQGLMLWDLTYLAAYEVATMPGAAWAWVLPTALHDLVVIMVDELWPRHDECQVWIVALRPFLEEYKQGEQTGRRGLPWRAAFDMWHAMEDMGRSLGLAFGAWARAVGMGVLLEDVLNARFGVSVWPEGREVLRDFARPMAAEVIPLLELLLSLEAQVLAGFANGDSVAGMGGPAVEPATDWLSDAWLEAFASFFE